MNHQVGVFLKTVNLYNMSRFDKLLVWVDVSPFFQRCSCFRLHVCFQGKITAPAVIVATGDTFLGVDIFFKKSGVLKEALWFVATSLWVFKFPIFLLGG